LERLGRLVCGPLWQSELARTVEVSRQTVLRWVADRAAGVGRRDALSGPVFHAVKATAQSW